MEEAHVEPKSTVSFHNDVKEAAVAVGEDGGRTERGDGDSEDAPSDHSSRYSTFKQPSDHETDRDRWPSRAAFYLAVSALTRSWFGMKRAY